MARMVYKHLQGKRKIVIIIGDNIQSSAQGVLAVLKNFDFTKFLLFMNKYLNVY